MTNDDHPQSLKRKRQDELPWCLVESEPGITTITFQYRALFLIQPCFFMTQPFSPRWHTRTVQQV